MARIQSMVRNAKTLKWVFGALLVTISRLALSQTELSDQFSVTSPGIIHDVRTDLDWAQQDSGGDTNWHQAKEFCEQKNEGWRLPTVKELQSLYQPLLSVACGIATCHTSLNFHLTGPVFWSADRSGESKAYYVYLVLGDKDDSRIDDSDILRALCVRKGRGD